MQRQHSYGLDLLIEFSINIHSAARRKSAQVASSSSLSSLRRHGRQPFFSPFSRRHHMRASASIAEIKRRLKRARLTRVSRLFRLRDFSRSRRVEIEGKRRSRRRRTNGGRDRHVSIASCLPANSSASGLSWNVYLGRKTRETFIIEHLLRA